MCQKANDGTSENWRRKVVRQITASGQTVEEAVESALEHLQTTRDQVEVTVIDEGKRGILGLFGSKLAVVNVSIKEDPIEETEAFIEEVAKNMGVSISVETTVEDNNILFELSGEKIALIIGKRGQTLNALQYLVQDRKSTRLNSSHVAISYAVFCL